MRNQGLGSWPARRTRMSPDKVALTHCGLHRTYRDLHIRTNRLAHALAELGVRRGDRVAYLGANHPALVETFFAAGALGAIFVPLNTRLTAPELRHIVEDAGAEVILLGAGHDGAGLPGRHVRRDPRTRTCSPPATREPIDEPVTPTTPA